MTLAGSLTLALATGLASFGLSAIGLRILADRAILDAPNARSSHLRPTPRGGGLAVMAALLAAFAVAAWAIGELGRLAPLLMGAVLIAGVSFLDDVKALGAGVRLVAQSVAVVVGLLALPEGLVGQGLVPAWLDRALTAVGWLWFVNLFNFMDGIDGITAVETIAIGAGVALVAQLGGQPGLLPALGLAAAAAAIGFLPWNWHRAKVFLGDVGSVPLGYCLGFLLLSLAAHGFWAAALVLPLYYLLDATWTLLKRLIRREKVWQAHREHWYQHAAAATRHDSVSLRIAAANLALVAVAAGTVLVSPGLLLLAGPVALLLVLELKRMARAERRP
ncbi:MAG: Undecaprenyl-phosphate alpha-N-acetylglucosaminyl 1-phosphate transferase [uncultured Microvirga sp.]|uniref:Undecaprenyl-phosphate alpha-N-acetylglucosaminyl 1-phosphate transferase n=1 Tax=uncultured Microvirga sp. TaxID=412392 RepID=A0A6J4KPI5_9HYPH|nr:MAG: Undecaprenyl-phosphate alpha-N-acetylglucosaminyl 1-phosphate transferase [uncultured Microvirga sp.]